MCAQALLSASKYGDKNMSTFTEIERECRCTGFDPGFETRGGAAVRLAPATSAAHVMYFKKLKLSDLDKPSAAAAPARRLRIDQPESVTRKLESALHVYGVSAAAFKHATKLSPMAHFPLPSELLAPREPVQMACDSTHMPLTRLTSSHTPQCSHAHMPVFGPTLTL